MVEAFDKRSTSKWSNVVVKPGDRVQLLTPGGGGWGKPVDRSVESIAEDVREGWITPDAASRDYQFSGKEGG